MLGEEEGSHARPENVVLGKDDVAAAHDVHGVAKRADLAAGHADIAAADEIEASLAGSHSRRRIEHHESRKEIMHQAHAFARGAVEADGCALELFTHADEFGCRLHDEVLEPAHDVARQVATVKTDRVMRRAGGADGNGRGCVIEKHAVVAILHAHSLANEIVAEIAFCHRLLRRGVFLRPDHDLPQHAVVPHELPALKKGAGLERDVLRVGGDFRFGTGLGNAFDRDHGPGDAERSDVPKAEVCRPAALSRADHDAARAGIRLPGVVAAAMIEALTGEMPSRPREVDDVGSFKQIEVGTITERMRQMKTRAVCRDGGVRGKPDWFAAGEMIIPRRNDHQPATVFPCGCKQRVDAIGIVLVVHKSFRMISL